MHKSIKRQKELYTHTHTHIYIYTCKLEFTQRKEDVKKRKRKKKSPHFKSHNHTISNLHLTENLQKYEPSALTATKAVRFGIHIADGWMN